jgi:hypothetical protein
MAKSTSANVVPLAMSLLPVRIPDRLKWP